MKTIKLGFGYQGSKGRIALDLLRVLPEGERFCDLFGGGFSMSHAAIYSHKYKSVLYNELKQKVADLVKDGIRGRFNYKAFRPEWISYEQFQKLKDTDGFVSYMYSFGADGDTYFCEALGEETMKAGHAYCVDRIPVNFPGIYIPVIGETIEKRREMLRRQAAHQFEKKWKHEFRADFQRFKESTGSVDKFVYTREETLKFTKWLRAQGVTPGEINKATGTFMGGHYLTQGAQPEIPTTEMWEKIRKNPKIKKIPAEIQELLSRSRSMNGNRKTAEEVLNKIRGNGLRNFDTLTVLYRLLRLQDMEHLKRIARIQNLEGLDKIKPIEITVGSYEKYTHRPGDVVYLDPPYEGTKGYGVNFNHKEFYDWCAGLPFPVYFSSYKISDDRFRLTYARSLNGTFGPNDKYNFECVYSNK